MADLPNEHQPSTESQPGGWWAWLKRTENQNTLRFVGAAIAAAVALLASIGYLGKPPERDLSKPPTPSANPTPPPAQTAITNDGNAVNIQGSGNQVGGKP